MGPMLSEMKQTWTTACGILHLYGIARKGKPMETGRRLGWNRVEGNRGKEDPPSTDTRDLGEILHMFSNEISDRGWTTRPICYNLSLILILCELCISQIAHWRKGSGRMFRLEREQNSDACSNSHNTEGWCRVKTSYRMTLTVLFIWDTQSSQFQTGRTENGGGQSWRRGSGDFWFNGHKLQI